MKALDLLADVKSGNLTKLRSLQAGDPALNEKVSGRYLAHYAAESRQLVVLRTLQAKGADLRLRDDEGNNLLHAACLEGDDDPSIVTFLLSRLGPVAYQPNAKGQTPLHTAMRFDLPGCTDALMQDPGKDRFLVKDNTGMTPVDRGVAFESVKAEQALYAAEPAADSKGPGKNLSTVEMLVWMTQSNNPDFFNEDVVKELMQDLYDDPTLRPMLEIAALDGFGGRAQAAPGDRQAFRIFLGDKTTGEAIGKGALGGYQAGGNSMTFDGRIDFEKGRGAWRDAIKGTLIHELTHHAAKVAYGNDAIPVPKDGNGQTDAAAERTFVQAFEADVKQSAHLAVTEEEHEIVRCLSKRLGSYTKSLTTAHRSYAPKETMQMEMIVGINQAVAQFGRPMVQKLFPTFTAYYDNTFLAAVRQESGNPNGLGAYNDGRVDFNADQARSKPVIELPVKVFQRVAGMETEAVVKMVERDYIVKNGKRPAVATQADLPYYLAEASLELDPADRTELDRMLVLVEKIVGDALANADMPPHATSDNIRSLVQDIGRACAKGAALKDVAKAAQARAKQFVETAGREFEADFIASQADFLARKVSRDYVLSPEEVADLVVVRAAEKVGGTNMNPEKYRKVAGFIADQIKAMPPDKRLAATTNPEPFIAARVGVLIANDQFFVKDKAVKSGSGHVSIATKPLQQSFAQQSFDFQVYAKDKAAYRQLRTLLEAECGAEAAKRLAFDDKTLRIDIGYGIKEVLDKFSDGAKRLIKAQADTALASRDNVQDALLSMASPHALEARAQANDQAYQYLRDNPPMTPGNALDLRPNDNPDDTARAMFAAQPGLCLAEEHAGASGKQSKVYLHDNMAGLKKAGVKTVFLEHLYAEYQWMIDDYLAGKPIAPLLDEALKKLDASLDPVKNVRGILDKARENGIRVVGIDSVNARVDTHDPLRGEHRAVRMNVHAVGIIEREQKKGGKFLVLAGSEHVNTSEKGIPGLSQLLGAHAIKVETTGKLGVEAEDPTRRQPLRSAAEQTFLDRFLDELERQQAGSAEVALDAAKQLIAQLGNKLATADVDAVARMARDAAGAAVTQLRKKKQLMDTASLVKAAQTSKVFAPPTPAGVKQSWCARVVSRSK